MSFDIHKYLYSQIKSRQRNFMSRSPLQAIYNFNYIFH